MHTITHTQSESSSSSLLSSESEVDPSTFEVGMKLEAVDRRFPYFVCVATIMDRSGMQCVYMYLHNSLKYFRFVQSRGSL